MKEIKELGMRELMRMSDVRRWHTVAVAREQTLADHSFRVALIALRLYWHQSGGADNSEVAALLTAALLHDAPEVHLGDPPPLGKFDRFAYAEHDLAQTLPDGFPKNPPPSPNTAALIKVADRIEAWLWIRENGIGDHAKEVTVRCLNVMNDAVVFYDLYEAAVATITEIIGKDPKLCPF